MYFSHYVEKTDQLRVDYHPEYSIFEVSINNNIALIMSQEQIETLYSESFGAMLHAEEKAEA